MLDLGCGIGNQAGLLVARGAKVRGFDSNGEVVAAARSWWNQHEDQRRFLWVHLFDPHDPYTPPAGFRDRLFAGGGGPGPRGPEPPGG